MKVITRENGSRRVIRNVEGESQTEQHHKDECNINSIVERYQRTGQVPVSARPKVYGDFTGVSDYHSAANAVIEASENFMSLPSDLRKRFNNDPAQLLAFLDDPENREEAMEIGLIERPAPQAPPEPESPSEPPTEPPVGDPTG